MIYNHIFLKTKNNRPQKGFSLVELLVSVALFTIVMTIGLSVILSIIDGNKKTQSINSVVNNLNSSIDSMVRDIKTGIEYKCNSNPDSFDHLPITAKGLASDCDITQSYRSVSFLSTITGTERGVKYTYVPPTSNSSGYINKEVCSSSNSCDNAPIRITSPEINVNDMRIYPKNMTGGINQPGFLIVIGGTAKINPTTTSNFYLQTFVSQRVLNI